MLITSLLKIVTPGRSLAVLAILALSAVTVITWKQAQITDLQAQNKILNLDIANYERSLQKVTQSWAADRAAQERQIKNAQARHERKAALHAKIQQSSDDCLLDAPLRDVLDSLSAAPAGARDR